MNWLAFFVAMAAVLCAAAVHRFFRAQRRFRFRHTSARQPGPPPAPRGARTPATKDRYRADKVPASLDAIVIGSGMGGLATAACLARCGWRVLVLEQHDVAGGCTHTFEEHGVEFDTGTHYVGEFDPLHSAYFDWITRDAVEWDDMARATNDYVYDLVLLSGASHSSSESNAQERIPLRAGAARFLSEFDARFPSDKEALRRYLALVRNVAETYAWFFRLKALHPRWLGSLLVRLALFVDSCVLRRGYLSKSVEDTLKNTLGITSLPLVNALCGQWGDYGVPPDQAPFVIHAAVVNHYLNGARFPRGGSARIAEALILTIEQCGGGRVLVEASVDAILLDSSSSPKAVGVHLSNGDIHNCPVIVSGTGFANTRSLLKKGEPPSWIDFERRLGAQSSVCMVYLYVALNGTPDELQLPAYNVWSWPGASATQGHGAGIASTLRASSSDVDDVPPTFIAFPCAKDSTWSARYPGKSSALVLTMCSSQAWDEHFALAEHNPRSKQRNSVAYALTKEEWEARLLRELQRHFPQLARDGVVGGRSVGTPLTFNYYVRSQRGEVYGLDVDRRWRFSADAFDVLRPETPIEGLYMTGQDVLMLGIAGATMSGVLTANSILRYGNVLEGVLGRDVLSDCRGNQC